MLNDFSSELAQKLVAKGLDVARAEEPYTQEPRGKFFGRPSFVARPRRTEDVAALITSAQKNGFGIVPYGGGTGLVGGQISVEGPTPLILSLERMNAVRSIYPEENAIVVEAGAILADIHAAADSADRLFPLSYASEGSARIGGALAVNSGGLNVLRYGMARDLCLGIEAVLPDGSILNGLKRLRKDNTGYDLRHLLIGAEGTLGVITAASLKLSPKPAQVATAFMAVAGPNEALALLSIFREKAGESVSAFELVGRTAFEFLGVHFPDQRAPFEIHPEWCILAELGTEASVPAQELMLEAFEAGLEAGLVSDGAIAQSEAQRAAFWRLRESIPEANRLVGAVASHDISLPLSEIAALIDDATKALGKGLRINAFGHLGDGNLHFNFFAPHGQNRRDFADRAPDLTRQLHDMVVARGGSFSAEHGIGRLKRDDLAHYGDPAKLAAMRAIKQALDPKGIMNPGVIF